MLGLAGRQGRLCGTREREQAAYARERETQKADAEGGGPQERIHLSRRRKGSHPERTSERYRSPSEIRQKQSDGYGRAVRWHDGCWGGSTRRCIYSVHDRG